MPLNTWTFRRLAPRTLPEAVSTTGYGARPAFDTGPAVPCAAAVLETAQSAGAAVLLLMSTMELLFFQSESGCKLRHPCQILFEHVVECLGRGRHDFHVLRLEGFAYLLAGRGAAQGTG